MSNPSVLRSLRGLLVATCAVLLTACASTSDISATSKPNVYTVTTHSRGVVMTWAGAHERAVNEAESYCAQRGMRASMQRESLLGGGAETHAELAFECHPVL